MSNQVNIADLNSQINEFRNITDELAISPDSLGKLLLRIVNFAESRAINVVNTLPLATIVADGLMSKTDKKSLESLLVELPVYRFDRVLFNEGSTEPEEVPGMAEGSLVLFLDENYAPIKVRVCADNWLKWIDLPRFETPMSDETTWTSDGVRVRLCAPPPTAEGQMSSLRYSLCPNSLFIVCGLETVNSDIAPEAGYAAVYYVDLNGRMQLLCDTKAGPMAQSSSEGGESRYIYSVADSDDARCVMTMRNTDIFQQYGQLTFRRGFWSYASEGGKYITRRIPVATTSADGAMSKEVLNRLGAGASIYEATATATTVPISYPNWASGGARTFVLGAATSARAGVMSSADWRLLHESLPEDVESARHAFFDDYWTASGGEVDRAGHPEAPYGLNGLWLTYEEAVVVAADTQYHVSGVAGRTIKGRTNFEPPSTASSGGLTNFQAPRVEVLNVGTRNYASSFTGWLVDAPKIVSIIGIIDLTYFNGSMGNCLRCPKLAEVEFYGLKRDFNIRYLAAISLESLTYLVNNAANGEAIITVTVHPDVYAKLTDEANAEWFALLTAAIAKNISFASAE